MNIQKVLERETEYINNLELPNLKKVRLYQMLYRGLAYDSSTYTLLHGSTAITKRGNAILFGDGVDCIGKTCTSLFTGMESGRYVIDEYSLHNEILGCIYGNSKMPIIVRNKMKGILPHDNWSDEEETFIYPEDMKMSVESSAKLKAIVAPHLGERLDLVEEKSYVRKRKKVAIVSNAHRLKFTDIGLDRGNGETHSDRKIELLDETIGYNVPEGLLTIPYYDAYLTKSEDIISLLKKEGL